LSPEEIDYFIHANNDYSFVRANSPRPTQLNTDLIIQSFKSGFVPKMMATISDESFDHHLFALCVRYFKLVEPYLDENLVVSLTNIFVDRTIRILTEKKVDFEGFRLFFLSECIQLVPKSGVYF
jgi:hypothetical protein